MEQGHDEHPNRLESGDSRENYKIMDISEGSEKSGGQNQRQTDQSTVTEWVRQDYQLIANRFNQNFEILSNRESLVNYLSQYLSDSPALFEAVCCAYDKGIFSFFQQGCNSNAREIRRMVHAIQKQAIAGAAGYRFWSEIIPLLTPDTLNFAVSSSHRWYGTLGNGLKSGCLTGCIFAAVINLLLCIGFLVLTMKSTATVRNFFIRPTQNAAAAVNLAVPKQAAGKESTLTPAVKSAGQDNAPTLVPTATLIPTATLTPTELPPASNALDNFVENVNNDDIHTDRRYLVTQQLPEKGRVESIEAVFEKIGMISHRENLPKWELIIEVSSSMNLPAYLELPADLNLTKVTIRNISGKTLTLSGKKPASIENIGLDTWDSISDIFGKGKNVSTLISNWCSDQIFDYTNGELENVHPSTGSADTGMITDNGADCSLLAEAAPESRKSSYTKEGQLPFLFANHGSILVTNGVPLEIGEQIELKDNSIYNGLSTKNSGAGKQNVELPAASVTIYGQADVIFLGGLAYNAGDQVTTDTSTAEIHGKVNKVFTGGMALDFLTAVITNHPTIHYVATPGQETLISEIQTGGINLSACGIVKAGDLVADPPIGEPTLIREPLPDSCKAK